MYYFILINFLEPGFKIVQTWLDMWHVLIVRLIVSNIESIDSLLETELRRISTRWNCIWQHCYMTFKIEINTHNRWSKSPLITSFWYQLCHILMFILATIAYYNGIDHIIELLLRSVCKCQYSIINPQNEILNGLTHILTHISDTSNNWSKFKSTLCQTK